MKLEEKNYDRKQQHTHTHTHTPRTHRIICKKNCMPYEISNARKQIVIIKVHRHFFVSLMMAL
jgi:hypothetical protein